jgi:hypothetical protein
VSLHPVAGLVGEDPADPAAWFYDIAFVARDEVKMGVVHSLVPEEALAVRLRTVKPRSDRGGLGPPVTALPDQSHPDGQLEAGPGPICR